MMNAQDTMSKTYTLATDDQVMATLTSSRGILATVNKKNFATINDVVRFVMALAGNFAGMAHLNIRNRTQGWAMNMALMAPSRNLSVRHQAVANHHAMSGRQLAFNF